MGGKEKDYYLGDPTFVSATLPGLPHYSQGLNEFHSDVLEAHQVLTYTLSLLSKILQALS